MKVINTFIVGSLLLRSTTAYSQEQPDSIKLGAVNQKQIEMTFHSGPQDPVTPALLCIMARRSHKENR